MQNTFIKKLIALTLAGCLALSSFPAIAFSDEIGDLPAEFSAVEMPAEPAEEPAAEPAEEPAAEPAEKPAAAPAAEPAAEPAEEPTAEPAEEPAAEPAEEPAAEPAEEPTAEPTEEPTAEPTEEPTAEPAEEPTAAPVEEPAAAPAEEPTVEPAEEPTAEPTEAPALFEAVQAVQKLIDALPSVDELNEENMAAAYEQTETAYIAYLALSADEQAQITGAEKFDALFAVFNAQIALLGWCNVSVSPREHCGVSVSPDGGSAGTLVTVTFTPDEGYYVDWVSVMDYDYYGVDHTKVSDTVYTFQLPDSSFAYVNYSVEVKDNYYTITTEAGEGGTIEVPASAQENASVTLTVKPNNGYQLSSLMVDGEDVTSQVNSSNQYTFTMPGKGINISATFTGGQVSFSVKIGGKDSVVKTVDAGTSFSSWYMSYAYAGGLGTSYWRVQHADGTNGSGTTSELGEIKDGDVYTQFAGKAYVSGQYMLQIFADCDVNELDNVSGYSYVISAGTLTVHHTVDGADKNFVLTGSKTKLSDFADGAQWCVNGEVVDMSSAVPLAKTAYTTTQSYYVIIAASENGSVSANPASAYQGKPVTLTIAPAAGYSLSKLTVNDEDVTASVSDGTYTFIMPEGNVNVSATFSLTAYRVSANNPSYGEITLSATEAIAGAEITVTLAPTTCYTLKTLTVDGEDVTAQVTENAYTFTMPSHNVAVNAEFGVIAYSIQGTTDGKAKVGDTLTVTPHDQEYVLWFGDDGYYYAEGQSLTVAEKYAGKTITCKIYIDMNCSPAGSGGYNADYPAATLTVQVEQAGYTITTTNTAITADAESYKAGETVKLTNGLPTGTVLTELTASYDNNGTETAVDIDSKSLTFTMPEGNVTVTAETAAGYYIDIVTVNKPEVCTITPGSNVFTAYGGRYYAAGAASVNFIVAGYDGYSFEVTGDKYGYSVFGSTITWDMIYDHDTVTVTFIKNPTITINPTTNGNVTAKDSDDKSITFAKAEETVYLKVEPSKGYKLKTLTVSDGENDIKVTEQITTGSYYFTMPAHDVTVTAEFEEALYNVTIKEGSTDYFSLPEGTAIQYKAGDTVKINLSIPNGKVLINAYVKKSGYSYIESEVIEKGETSFTFTMPESDVEISGTVTDGYYITLSTVGGNENCRAAVFYETENEPENANKSFYYNTPYATAGKAIRCSISPDAGYRYTMVVKDANGNTVKEATGTEYAPPTFTMPEGDVTITVTFEKLYMVSIVPMQDGETYCSLPNGKTQYYAAGDIVTVNVDKEKLVGKVLDITASWKDNDKLVIIAINASADGSSFTFTMPENNVDVESQVYDGYYITVNKVGGDEKCTVTPADNTVETSGYNGKYYAESEKGYLWNITCPGYTYTVEVKDAKGGNVTTINYEYTKQFGFEMPTSDVTVTVTFTKAAAPSYTITIPSSVSLNDAESMTITASDVQNLNGQAISVAVTSENGGKLKYGDNEIGYTFDKSLTFRENGGKSLALTIGDTTGKPAGTYTDTLNFTVSLTGAAAGE